MIPNLSSNCQQIDKYKQNTHLQYDKNRRVAETPEEKRKDLSYLAPSNELKRQHSNRFTVAKLPLLSTKHYLKKWCTDYMTQLTSPNVASSNPELRNSAISDFKKRPSIYDKHLQQRQKKKTV